MKKAATFVLAAALLSAVGAGSFAQTAHAQRAHSTRQASTSVTVIIIRDYIGPDDFQQVPMTYRNPSAQTYARGQEEIRSNADIRAILQRRGIPFRNVTGVQTAFNGGKIVYVR
ncbi:hypothetical protein ADU59_22935 [Pararhizobium polonicum]|uniref:Uncharacterized protein n=1 Tax=Pararhizobium polonicum TaxID=1612624 RepID=A0A1C7P0V9_9HYPH|nr:hypothetical protein [Pararhizobium polonicum]OBZ93304.1 hypothetical protein ADU59_22935 [Pararhizobium polonicum]